MKKLIIALAVMAFSVVAFAEEHGTEHTATTETTTTTPAGEEHAKMEKKETKKSKKSKKAAKKGHGDEHGAPAEHHAE